MCVGLLRNSQCIQSHIVYYVQINSVYYIIIQKVFLVLGIDLMLHFVLKRIIVILQLLVNAFRFRLVQIRVIVMVYKFKVLCLVLSIAYEMLRHLLSSNQIKSSFKGYRILPVSRPQHFMKKSCIIGIRCRTVFRIKSKA